MFTIFKLLSVLDTPITHPIAPTFRTPNLLDRGRNEASTSQVAKLDQRKGTDLMIRHKEPVKFTPSTTSEFDVDEVLANIYGGRRNIISFKGSSQYGDKLGTRISASTCGLAALNFARIAFRIEEQGMQGLELLTELLSRETNEEITSICDYWKSDSHLEIEELLKVPIFKNSLALQSCAYSHASEQHFHDLLQDMVDPLDPSSDFPVVAIITRPPEIVACLKIRIADKDVFVIFDSHPRPSYPDGQGFIINPTIEAAAAYLSDLLPIDENILNDPSLQWQAQLLGHFSGHILLPSGEKPSTTEVLLESSMALLSTYADVAREKSRSSELQQKLEELEKQQRLMEDRLRYFEQHRREDYEHHRDPDRPNTRRTEYNRDSDKSIPSKSYRGSSPSSSSKPDWLSSYYQSIEDDGPAGWQTTNRSGKKDKGKGKVIDFGFGLGSSNAWDQTPSSSSSSRRDRGTLPIDQRWGPPLGASVPWLSGVPTVSKLDGDAAIARELQRQFEAEDQQLRAQREALRRPAPVVFRCSFCMEDQPGDSVARIEKCQHAFCRDCLRDCTTSKVSERRVPIVCPICTTESERPEPGRFDDTTPPPDTPIPGSPVESKTDRDAAMAMELQREFEAEDQQLRAEKEALQRSAVAVFRCSICMKDQPEDSVARIEKCQHAFCRDCLWDCTTSKTSERRIPIVCPICATERERPEPGLPDDTTPPSDTPIPGSPVVSKTDRDVAMVIEPQREFETEDQQLKAEQEALQGSAPGVFRCCICMEDQQEDSAARIEKCQHAFCRDCLRDYTTSKISERRIPIVCPICATESERPEPGLVDETIIQQIGISDNHYKIYEELQISIFSVSVHCRRCEQTMFINREELQEIKEITCSLPGCQYVWCKACQQPIEADGPKHSCDGSNEFEHLMQEQGWRFCPSCRTPVLKIDGCNHISCIAPGCNTCFCYVDGALISRGGTSAEILAAKTNHFANCKIH